MQKIILFCDSSILVPTVLTKATCDAVLARYDMRVVALCMLDHPNSFAMTLRFFRAKANWLLRSATNLYSRSHEKILNPGHPGFLAKRLNIDIVVPPEKNVNHPEFIELLSKRYPPSVLLTYFFSQKLCPSLLAIFEQAVNYHNGLLPGYRGLKATSWSVYLQETTTGFTFHRMTVNLDEGPILLQGAISVDENKDIYALNSEKTLLAAGKIPELLDLIAQHSPGTPQTGPPRYFSLKDFQKITAIPDLSSITGSELIKRSRAFGELQIRINGRWFKFKSVTRVTRRQFRPGWVSFATSDDVKMRGCEYRWLPYPICRAFRKIFSLGNQVEL